MSKNQRKLLEDVMEVGGYIAGKDQRCPESIPFPSCLASAMRYLGEDYPWKILGEQGQECKLNMANVEFLGASGMAFGLLWSKDNQCLSCMDLTLVNSHNETIKNALDWAGYKIELLEKSETNNQEEIWREKIINSIDQNVPVLAFGVIGPPECCLITGYDESGDVLIGWNYFQNEHDEFEPTGQFRKRDWHSDTWKIILIKEKTERSLTPKQTLQNGLEIIKKEEIGGYYVGFKAYDAWIRFLKDEDIETRSDEQVKEMHTLHHLLVGNLAEARCWGGEYFKRIVEFEPDLKAEMLECASKFLNIHDLMWKIWGVLGGWGNEEAYIKFKEPDLRAEIISFLEQAQEKDKEVVAILEKIVG